jgi:DNA-binding CsgD family transcriptional regulator
VNSRTAPRIRRELVGLCHRGLDVPEFVSRAASVLRQAVPFERSCWHTIDPATSMLTGAIKDNFAADPRFPRYEYAIEDVNKFAHLGRLRSPAGVLGHATSGCPERSPRYRDLLEPLGIGFELRSAFVADDGVWGACALYRGTSDDDFREEEAELVASLSPVLAEGFRKALLVSAVPERTTEGPGLVLLADDDEVRSITASAERLLADVVEVGIPTPGTLPSVVYAVASRAREAADDEGATPSAMARARTLTRSGQWLVLHGTRLEDTDGATAIIVEPAHQAEIASLIVAAYGLSAREREITQLALLGLSTSEIGERLHISPLTVQDHLKSIFGKVGVTSRKQLVARIFVDHYEPRLRSGQTPTAGGFFAQH